MPGHVAILPGRLYPQPSYSVQIDREVKWSATQIFLCHRSSAVQLMPRPGTAPPEIPFIAINGLSDGAEVDLHSSNPLLSDTDGDGLSDLDEVTLHQTSPILRDTDGDGFDDAFELQTGFDPTQAASTPDALSTIRTAVEFRFNAANGVSYRIEASSDLETWQTIETDIPGQGGVITRFYSLENHPKRNFRVRRNQ